MLALASPIGGTPPQARAQTSKLAKVTLPVRAAVFVALIVTLVPLLTILAWLRAVYMRLVRGRASAILRAYQEPYRSALFYPGQMVFDRPFDHGKLHDLFYAMAEEAGIDRKKVRLDFETEVPRPFPQKSGAMEADHYVERGTNFFKKTFTVRNKVLWLRVFTGSVSSPTVLQLHLAGGSWDGNSCFNFMKELVNRYYGGHNDVFKGGKLTLRPESAAKLDESSFVAFLARLPRNVALNSMALLWQFLGAPRLLGGGGVGPDLALINFDEEDSKRLAAGVKSRGAKPFAAMTFAAVSAYRAVLGKNPYCLVQQASMQPHHYEPKLERNLVGDWLIGPLQYIPDGEYGLEEAQRGYERFRHDLEHLGESVKRAFDAKAYGLYNGGAAVFEVLPTYGDDAKIYDGIFFNNYGVRTVRPESGFVSWNWGAPFKLGFNTINVNGKTCICLATTVLGLGTIRAVRDHVEWTLKGLMDGNDEDGAPVDVASDR